MSDNKNKTDYRDRDRININEKYELQYWSEKFNISPERLKSVVQGVGPIVKDVENALKK